MRHDGGVEPRPAGAPKRTAQVPWWGVGLVAMATAFGVAALMFTVIQPAASGAPSTIVLPAPTGPALTKQIVRPTTVPPAVAATRPVPQSTIVPANRTVVTEVGDQIAATIPSTTTTSTSSPSTTTSTTDDSSGPSTTEPHDHLKRSP